MTKKRIRLLLGFLVLASIGFVLWLTLREVIHYVKATDSKLIASLITASATVLVGIGAVLISQNHLKKRELEEAHRESKIEIYNRFNSFLFDMLSGINNNVTGDKITDQEVIDFMKNFKRDLIFRASPEVLKAYLRFEVKSKDSKLDILHYMDRILLAMRKDIGLDNRNLDNYELIQLFLKDKEEVKKIKIS